MEPLLGAARICVLTFFGKSGALTGIVVTDWGDMDIVVDGAEAVAAGNDIIMPGGPPVIQQILKGKEESRLTRQKLEIAVEHLLSVLRRLERLDRHDTI